MIIHVISIIEESEPYILDISEIILCFFYIYISLSSTNIFSRIKKNNFPDLTEKT